MIWPFRRKKPALLPISDIDALIISNWREYDAPEEVIALYETACRHGDHWAKVGLLRGMNDVMRATPRRP